MMNCYYPRSNGSTYSSGSGEGGKNLLCDPRSRCRLDRGKEKNNINATGKKTVPTLNIAP